MKIVQLRFLCFASLFFVSIGLFGQSTFDQVYAIFQNNCTNSGCHNGATSGEIDFSKSKTQVFSQLVNVDASNFEAKQAGYKRIDPGYPSNSVLLKKIATDSWDSYLELEESIADDIKPLNMETLAHEEIELVRQWILHGARANTQDVDPQVLFDYYNGKGAPRLEIPEAPATEEGYQIRLGPFFLEPEEELEIFKKHRLTRDIDEEIHKIEVVFNDESHHFILYKNRDDIVADVREGIRPLEEAENAMFDNSIVAAWQTPLGIELPKGTAYFWDKDDILDLNYHLLNYSSDNVLGADVYINIYTQPKGTAELEMHSELIPIDIIELFLGFPLGRNLVIPNTGEPITFSSPVGFPNRDESWHIWLLSSHTHATGIDYDIFKRNPDGTKGDQLFEGFFNFEYTFNQGYYDWEHPPVRFFDPLLEIDMNLNRGGIIHEATYLNNTDETKYWGDKTTDEMMLFFVQFTTEPLSVNVEDELRYDLQAKVFPNPIDQMSTLSVELDKPHSLGISIQNAVGQVLFEEKTATLPVGNFQMNLQDRMAGLPKGIYLLKLSLGGQQKVIKLLK